MSTGLDKVNKLGSAINNWTKIIVGLVVFIVALGTAWYKIESNAIANIRQDGQFKEVLETMTREFELMASRSGKRYKRAKEEDDDLHDENKHLHDEIKELREQDFKLVKEIWYIKGKLNK